MESVLEKMAGVFLLYLKNSVVTGLIAAGLMLLTPYLNKRIASKWKYWVWIFLAVWLLIPFGGANALLPATTQSVEREADDTADMPVQLAPQRQIVVEIPTQVTVPVTMQLSGGSVSVTVLDFAAVVWVLGSLIFVAVHLISYLHFKRHVRIKGVIIEESDVLCQLAELKQELRIKSFIGAVKLPGAYSPMMTGFFKPVLILPQGQYRPEQLYFIMKHELVHWKRRDVFIKLLFAAANAVHWFNPLIWMMQKEAVIDMELSCDECVTRNADYTVRKAYAETLLSILCEQCAESKLFLTRFCSDKQIMKMRFCNILENSGKKRGTAYLLGAIFLTAILGAQVGYSVAKEDAEDSDVVNSADEISIAISPLADIVEDSVALLTSGEKEQDSILDNTRQLVFFKEGELEEKRSELTMGDGYCLYLPEGEWKQSGSDEWTGVVNEQVHLWITHFENQSVGSVNDEIASEGYKVAEYGDLTKLQEETIYKVRVYESGSDVWCVFYCYPVEAEEGWGRELPVIVDTFAVTVP